MMPIKLKRKELESPRLNSDMRHRKTGKTLDRKRQPRNLMIKNLACSLILYEKVQTTNARAKAVQSYVEKLISLGMQNNLSTRRHLIKALPVKNAVVKVIEDLSQRFKNRRGGYSRIVKLAQRQGDAAKMVYLSLVD